jgi:chromosome segregation ATPase
LRKEVEQLKNELKNSSNELNASENRLKRASQEIEKHKSLVKTLRQEEKVKTQVQVKKIIILSCRNPKNRIATT